MLDYGAHIVSMQVDALKYGIIPFNPDEIEDFKRNVLPLLESCKAQAQAIQAEDNAERFVKTKINGHGDFKVYAVGNRRYKYRLECENYNIFICTIFDLGTPVVRVELKAKTLFALGHKGAYQAAQLFVDSIFSDYRVILSEIHLNADVANIQMETLDKQRFRYQGKSVEYEHENYEKGSRISGYVFGRDEFMFRLYDKTLEIQYKPSAAYIKERWTENGWSEDAIFDKVYERVWRHEVQYRRDYLKEHFGKKDVENEVAYYFGILQSLWTHAINKVRYVPVTDDELSRIVNLRNLDSKRIEYLRIEKKNRPSYWDKLKVYAVQDYDDCGYGYKTLKKSDKKKAVKYCKMFMGIAARAWDSPYGVVLALYETERQMREMQGYGAFTHVVSTILADYARDKKLIETKGVVFEYDWEKTAHEILEHCVKNYQEWSHLFLTEGFKEYCRAAGEDKVKEYLQSNGIGMPDGLIV